MKEKKARVEDALHATRAAVEEGVVPGGGVALVRAPAENRKLKGDNEDQNVGLNILQRALAMPLRQIAGNAGADGAVVLDKVRSLKGNDGYNAASGEYAICWKWVFWIQQGYPFSPAGCRIRCRLMITTEAMIAELPEEKPAGPAMPPGWYGWNGWYGRYDVSAGHRLKTKKPRQVRGFFFGGGKF